MTTAGIGWVLTIIIGGLVGWLAEKVMKTDNSMVVDIALGVLGALILNALLISLVGGIFGGLIGQLVSAAIGAFIAILGYRAIRARS